MKHLRKSIEDAVCPFPISGFDTGEIAPRQISVAPAMFVSSRVDQEIANAKGLLECTGGLYSLQPLAQDELKEYLVGVLAVC